MSLICVQCGKTVIQSNNPDHYGNCSSCGVDKLTEEQKRIIKESSPFYKKIGGEQ